MKLARSRGNADRPRRRVKARFAATRSWARRLVLVAVALAAPALLAAAGAARAQGYPERPINMVVPFPAGGAVDPVARVLANRAGELLRQTVVIHNRPGAGGNIGAESVARAAPDGYTVLFGSTSLSIGPALYARLGYDLLRDLLPVTQVTSSPNILVVHPSLPVTTVKQLVALARSRPGQLISASAGVGSSNYLSLLLFLNLARVDITHVPFKGAAPAVADVTGGHSHMTFVPIPGALSLVQAGKLRALAVTAEKRSFALPELPTIAETVPGYEMTSWNGVFVPAGTPPAVVARLHGVLVETLNTPAVKEALVKLAVEPVGSSQADFDRKVRADLAKWGKVIASAGVKPQ
jgi:tripartite-type tricarboxylate transporter receptor subunit TctC